MKKIIEISVFLTSLHFLYAQDSTDFLQKRRDNFENLNEKIQLQESEFPGLKKVPEIYNHCSPSLPTSEPTQSKNQEEKTFTPPVDTEVKVTLWNGETITGRTFFYGPALHFHNTINGIVHEKSIERTNIKSIELGKIIPSQTVSFEQEKSGYKYIRQKVYFMPENYIITTKNGETFTVKINPYELLSISVQNSDGLTHFNAFTVDYWEAEKDMDKLLEKPKDNPGELNNIEYHWRYADSKNKDHYLQETPSNLIKNVELISETAQ